MADKPTTIAAIDVGSNGIRLSIAETDSNATAGYTVIHRDRAPVRLGVDAFKSGELSDRTISQTMDALKQFRQALNQHSVSAYRAVATAAARATRNIHHLLEAAKAQADLQLEVITDLEEAQLLLLAIQSNHPEFNDEQAPTLVIDMGGGSIELILDHHQHKKPVPATRSFPIGPVRLLQQLKDTPDQLEEERNAIIQSAGRQIQAWLEDLGAGASLSTTAYAAGGNIEALAKTRKHLLNKNKSKKLKLAELHQIIPILNGMSIVEKITKCHWRRDRADIIDFAAATLLMIMQCANLQTLIIPKLSIRDGILTQLLSQLSPALTEESPRT